MITDIARFVAREQVLWEELERLLLDVESQVGLTMEQASRLHYLYERAAAGLGQLQTLDSDPALQGRLETLVARAYAQIHSLNRRRRGLRPVNWFFRTFPQTVRSHWLALTLATATMLAGCVFGAGALAINPKSKAFILPFGHLHGNPAERVKQEETRQAAGDRAGHEAFASYLWVNNTRVSIFTLALGATAGVGTLIVLFYNGVILGAVIFDYLQAGQGLFMAGWLLPHGSIEIPAILLAGQASFILAGAIIGRNNPLPLKLRLAAVRSTLLTLITGVAILLVWAGIIESFLSQYHQPIVPYWLKISFGCLELAALSSFICLGGRRGVVEAA